MLSLFTFAVIEAPAFGWTSPFILRLFVGAGSMLIAFVLIELQARRPMLDLSLFRHPQFVGVQLLPIATCYSYVVLLILLPLRFVGVEELSEIDAGLLMLALSAPMLFVPFIAANLARWISPGILSSIGLLIAAAGVFWLGRMSPGAGPATVPPLIAALPVVPPMLVIGFSASIPWGLMDGLSVRLCLTTSPIPGRTTGQRTKRNFKRILWRPACGDIPPSRTGDHRAVPLCPLAFIRF